MARPSLLLVALGGMCTALAFPLQPIPQLPPLCLWPLVFVAPAPYLARLMNCGTIAETTRVSLTFGCTWIFLAGVWVFRMFDALGWILIWLPVVAIIVFGIVAHLVHRAGWSELWTWPLLWMCIEFVRGEWSPVRLNWLSVALDPMNFTWFGLGHPRCAWAPAAQSADLMGGYVLSLAPMLTSVLVARTMIGRWPRFWPSVVVCGVLAAETGYCLRAWQTEFRGPMVPAGVVQSERFNLGVLVQLTKDLLRASPQTRLVVWPEESFAAESNDREILRELAKQHQVVLAVGVETPRPDGGHFNMAWWLPPDGDADEYHKQQRVPFVEMHAASDTCKTFDFRIDGSTVKVAVLICYDVDFPWNPRRVVDECGAQVILMPTLDDVTWGGTQHAQHALMPRLRAIENRRSLVQAATSGYSQIIDPHGRVLVEIPFRLNMRPDRSTVYKEGFAAATIPAIRRMSVYTRGGHWMMPIATWIAALLVAQSLIRGWVTLS